LGAFLQVRLYKQPWLLEIAFEKWRGAGRNWETLPNPEKSDSATTLDWLDKVLKWFRNIN
jgi:hypothetical protein